MSFGVGRAAVAAALVLSASCARPGAQLRPLRLSPEQAVMNAATSAEGVSGTFEMVVRTTGRQGGFLYLNSELDYRDQRNLTIEVSAAVEQALETRFQAPVEMSLRGKVVAVRGTARKVRIDFTQDGRPTGKYYYQTHVRLGSARSLTVEGERPVA